MKEKYALLGFALFILISLMTHVGDICFTAHLCYWLHDTGQIVWMALITCLLVVPLLAVQLASYQLHALRLGGTRRGCDVGVIVWHTLQLGLVWRYCRLACCSRITISNKEVGHLFILQAAHAFFSTLLRLAMGTYLALSLGKDSGYTAEDLWPVLTAMVVMLVSAVWVLATFTTTKSVCCAMGPVVWSALPSKLLWKLGEVTSRMLVLCVFASSHRWWILLVVAVHLCLAIKLNMVENNLQGTQLKFWWDILLKPYSSLFCYFSAGIKRSRYGFPLYYTLTSVESIILLIMWLAFDKDTHLHLELTLVIILAYLTGLAAAVIYYNCYHRALQSESTSPQASSSKACPHHCSKCTINSCSRHRKPNKPWLSTIVQVKDNPGPHCCDMLPTAEYENCRQLSSVSGSSRLQIQGQGQRLARQILGEDVDFIWDDYDLKELPEGDAVDTLDAINVDELFHLPQTTLRGSGLDHGYYSGISSSSNEIGLMNGGISNDMELVTMCGAHCRRPVFGDDISLSVLSTVSSRVPMVNCTHCGHTMSLDSSSLYSATTNTSFSGSQLVYLPCHQPHSSAVTRPSGIWRQKPRHPTRHQSMPNRHYKGGKRSRQRTGQSNAGVINEDTACSSKRAPISDSEV